MVWQRLAVTAFTVLVLVCGSLLPTQAEEERPQGKEAERLDALARKLNLTDKQKQQVKQLYADFDKKADPLIRQLCTQRGEQWEALQKMFNEGQRTKLKEFLKAQGAKELQSIAQKLNLTQEQKEKVEKIRKDFWKKFLDMSIQRPEHLAREYRELQAAVIEAAREVLTPEQRAKLPAIQREDFNEWHDFLYRHEHLKALGEQLGLSDAQRDQLQQLCAAQEKKMEPLRAKIKQLCKEECATLEKVLTDEQRARLYEVFPLNFLQTDHHGTEKGQKE